MKFTDVKRLLNDNDLYVWQLAKAMEINTATLYRYSHYDFKGHTKQLFNGLDELGIHVDKIMKGSKNHD